MPDPVVYPRQPDWYDRPPMAGRYVFVCQGEMDLFIIGQEYVAEYAAIEPVGRFYGPLPPDPKES